MNKAKLHHRPGALPFQAKRTHGTIAALLLTAFCVRAASPTLQVPQSELHEIPVLVAYGDTRFTNTSEHGASNPKVRKWIVDQIAEEKPDAVLMSGDLPWHGTVANDYAVFETETQSWRDENLRILPALGNHELYNREYLNGEKGGLENWWKAFPELRGKRWYSAEVGDTIYVICLDSNSSLQPGSEQMNWVEEQLRSLPASVKFVFFNMHHPPMADYQRFGDPMHNPRHNEKHLIDLLNSNEFQAKAAYVVIAGHIHNYERFESNGIVYIVSGGGGAAPRNIHRGSDDLYRSSAFPNYHYVRFALKGNTLEGTMNRVVDPEADHPKWEQADHFGVKAK